MAYFFTETVSPTTNASGAVTATTAGQYNGFVHAIIYTVDGTNPYANNVVFAITGVVSGVTIWSQTLSSNASVNLYPRAATQSTAGAASLYAAAGQAVNDKIALVGEQIQIAITSGGNTKVGKFVFIIGG